VIGCLSIWQHLLKLTVITEVSMFVVLNDILIFREGVVDFVFVGKTKQQDKAIRALKEDDTFPFEGETYRVEKVTPLIEDKDYYSHTVRVKV
jgi:hypothetical protein